MPGQQLLILVVWSTPYGVGLIVAEIVYTEYSIALNNRILPDTRYCIGAS